MKWLGQYIQSFTARFRNDVYLEDVSSGTIASGGNLGLDSNNKIVKAAVSSGGISFDGSTANGVLTYKDADEATVESNLTFDGGTLTLTGDLIVNGDAITFESTNTNDPQVIIKNTTNDNQAARIQFFKNRTDAAADNDRVAELDFIGEDAAGSTQQYGKMMIQAVETSHGSETGKMRFQVAEYDGTQTDGLILTGGSADGKIDVTLGAGTASRTAVAGILDVTTEIGTPKLTMDSVELTTIQTSEESFADNDTSVMTSAAIEDKILAYGYTNNTGDITGIKFITDTGDSLCVQTSENATFNLTGGEGVDITNSTTTITIAGEDATDTNKGIVELATLDEATTGTDTARAVTPAGVDAHVDGRFTYQYMHFSFRANGIDADCWLTPSQRGPEYADWDNIIGPGKTQVSSGAPSAVDTSATISVDYLDQTTGFIVPQNCKLAGFRGAVRLNVMSPNNLRPILAIFRAAQPSDRNNADITATCIAFDKYDTTAATTGGSNNNMKNRFLALDTSVDVSLTAGDILFPAIGLDGTANDDNTLAFGSFTIMLKTLIP